MNIICFGDSITYAGGAEKNRWPTALQFKLEEWKPGRYDVYNRGVGGNTTAQGLMRIVDDVLSLLPGIVLVEFGFNDAHCPLLRTRPRVGEEEFEQNLLSIGCMIRRRKGRVVYIVNHRAGAARPAQGDGRSYARRLDRYNDACRRVARKLAAPTIDLPTIMRKRRVRQAEFYQDHVHLTPQGNHVYADMVFDALREILR